MNSEDLIARLELILLTQARATPATSNTVLVLIGIAIALVGLVCNTINANWPTPTLILYASSLCYLVGFMLVWLAWRNRLGGRASKVAAELLEELFGLGDDRKLIEKRVHNTVKTQWNKKIAPGLVSRIVDLLLSSQLDPKILKRERLGPVREQ